MICEFLYIYWDPSLKVGFIRWYSLCWLIGLLLAYLCVKKLYKQQNIKEELFDPLFVYSFVGILAGSRLGHCIFYQPDYFLSSLPHMVEMILPIHFTPDGSWKFTGYEGLASHGGTLGLMIALWLYVRKTKLSIWRVLDNIAIATPLTAFFIRIGNLMNSEIIGKVTDVPWAFIFARVDSHPRHPGQLYEAIAYAILFFIGWHIYKKHSEKVGTGFFFGLCLTYIFVARFFIEYTKEVQEAFEAYLPIDMGQILSIPFIILGIYCMIRSRKVLAVISMLVVSTVTINAQSTHADRVKLADKDVYGYLYCHMSRRGEWTAFALSRDGINYHDLYEGNEVYDTKKLSGIEGGARDAYIARAADGKSFVMVTTDMCVKNSKHWYNYGINLLKSDDLINWRAVTFDFRKGLEIFCDPESPDVYKDYSAINRVWAPQVMWDETYEWNDGEKGGYFIYYSLLNGKEDKYDRIFYSYADRSFTKLTKPQVLIDWGYATIDTDINYVEADGKYHILIKKESGKPGIFTTVASKITGPYPEPDEKDFVSFEGNKKCEGPSAFQLSGENTWHVAYVEYSSRPAKYRICQADEYLHNFHTPTDIVGVDAPQHGSFLQLTKKEYKRLEKNNKKYIKNHNKQ